MDQAVRSMLDDLYATDKERQNKAYSSLLAATEQPVDWAYDAWDELLAALRHKDNHVRAIASQVLSNLAKSDPKGRMLTDFDRLLEVTKDERFVTARHCLQSLWKIGTAGEPQRRLVVDGLSRRYNEAPAEKNGTLIRYDIIEGLRKLYDATGDESIRERALALIETEQDEKYRKKYAGLWKDKRASVQKTKG